MWVLGTVPDCYDVLSPPMRYVSIFKWVGAMVKAIIEFRWSMAWVMRGNRIESSILLSLHSLLYNTSSRLSGNYVDSITTATVHLILLTARGTSLATL